MISPSQDYERTAYRPPERLLQGIDAWVHGLMGRHQRRARVLGDLRRDAERVDAQAGDWLGLTDHQLQERLHGLRERFRRGGQGAADAALPALAGIREAADRRLGMRPFLVQIMGAMALHRGYLAEMATGEGKTLTAGLAAILAGWTRRPCHVVTVNDYLVERDADWIRPLYTFCGVRVGTVTGAMDPPARTRGYSADITYVTSKELLADFLRDRLRLGDGSHPTRRLLRKLLRRGAAVDAGLVMRGLHTAIVDEADCVLIDEAVTPLIISSPRHNADLQEAVRCADRITQELACDVDYRVNPRHKEIELTPAGQAHIGTLCEGLPGIWRGSDRRDELIRQALVAREFFLRDQHYILTGDRIVIVDEFTGRQMPQRTWRQGLHQAIEAKESLEMSAPSETIARLSFQRFFRCFHRLSGMTGTAREAAGEFWRIYRLPVLAIPSNRPCARRLVPDRVFADEASKWAAVAQEVAAVHATGRPVLVGTRSVQASERLMALLAERELPCRLLNAVRHQEEATVIAMAGEPGCVTIATNMAGRGTDIRLGQGVVAKGGLHVMATERHESGRVDRQLFGRAARQGDPGSGQAFVSAEDELLRRFLPIPVQTLLKRTLRSAAPGSDTFATTAIRMAQKRAEAQAYKQRQSVLRSDTWLDEGLAFAGLDIRPASDE